MLKILPAILAILSVICLLDSQSDPLQDAQTSHIDSNVPSSSKFVKVLEQDLLEFFIEYYPNATSVEFDLLRKEATQTGVSNPKFYAWVKILSGDTMLDEGAVRVAAVEKTHFDITSYQRKEEILKNSDEVAMTFPSALVPEIIARAKAVQ